jgi:hypothetical protein
MILMGDGASTLKVEAVRVNESSAAAIHALGEADYSVAPVAN